METVYGNLAVKALDKDFEINNGIIGLRLFFRDGGYAQEFYARDRKGQFQLILSSIHKDLIPSSEHRTCASPMISGERSHLFGVSRESLRMVLSNVKILSHDKSRIVVLLTGTAQNHSISYTLTIEDNSNIVHIEVEDEIKPSRKKPLIEYLMSSYAFLPEGRCILSEHDLSYAWAPTLRPAADQVIGDHAFHSPAAIVQRGRYSASFIPDIDILAQNRVMPAALDLDLNNGLLYAALISYGFCGYDLSEDNLSYHDMTMSRRLETTHINYGYHIVLSARSEARSAYKDTADFLWKTYGVKYLAEDNRRRKSEAISSQPSSHPMDMWAVYGMCQPENKSSDVDLVLSAKAVKDRLLSLSDENGLFPTRFDINTNEWTGCNHQPEGAYYHTTECSRQLYWLLKWYANVDQDKKIISFARHYADFLISQRLRSGAIPSWYTLEGYPVSLLRSSCQTSISALFLAKLAEVTGLAKYTKAAEQSANFILKDIMPRRLYQDYTLINTDKNLSLECTDPHTGAPPQSALAMLWTAQMFLALYNLTQNKKYITSGLQALDQLCLLQSVWNKPWEIKDTFGLFAAGNINTHYSPELSAEAACCLMAYGAITGERDYGERAAAAIAAARKAAANPVSAARIAASASELRSKFGCAYVHMGKKWAVALDQTQINQAVFGSGNISINISTTSAQDENRIKFGGMRGSSYKISINGESAVYSRLEMESGITVPKSVAQSEPTKSIPASMQNQQSLFDLS